MAPKLKPGATILNVWGPTGLRITRELHGFSSSGVIIVSSPFKISICLSENFQAYLPTYRCHAGSATLGVSGAATALATAGPTSLNP